MKLDHKFWSKVQVHSDGCWKWTAYKKHNGYGQITTTNGKILTHRASYLHFKGEIPDGMCVCHKCDNPDCVNPAHLWLGTHQENIKDRDEKGRGNQPKGVHNGNSKLTENDVRAIRNDSRKQREIASDYGVNQQVIWAVKNRKTWAHVED